jgi:hypothetical protein
MIGLLEMFGHFDRAQGGAKIISLTTPHSTFGPHVIMMATSVERVSGLITALGNSTPDLVGLSRNGGRGHTRVIRRRGAALRQDFSCTASYLV